MLFKFDYNGKKECLTRLRVIQLSVEVVVRILFCVDKGGERGRSKKQSRQLQLGTIRGV